jgi:putative endonuclease
MWFSRKRQPDSGAGSSRARGQQIEALAETFLRQQGLKPVTRNYTIKAGEIDLIMREGEVLVFVEVRYRASGQHGSGAESITHTKQQKLLKTASHYLQKHYANREPDCRFDVISASGEPVQFQWIRNAFGY